MLLLKTNGIHETRKEECFISVPLLQHRIRIQHHTKLVQCHILNLAHAFLAETHRVADLLESQTVLPLPGEPVRENGGLQPRQIAEVLFEDPERLSLRAIGRLLRLLEKSPPWKAAMAVRPLRSAFLNGIFAVSKDVREEKARIRREAGDF